MSSLRAVRGLVGAFISGTKHIFRRRITLRYPDVKLDLGVGYEYDPKKNVGLPGYKGRHILYLDKCTGCQLCAIACENIANCIEMVKVDVSVPVNRKSIFPQIDYGNCVFCAFCVDACPFYALFMTDDYELSSFDKKSLIYTPQMLALPPTKKGTMRLEVDEGGAHHTPQAPDLSLPPQ